MSHYRTIHMKWIQNVVRSVYDPGFYRDIVTGKEVGSFKYFFILIAAFSVLSALPAYITFSSWISRPDGFESFRDSVSSLYPDGLVLRLQDGHVTSNVDGPYLIPIPESLRDSATTRNGKAVRNILVIDTIHTIVPEDFAKYDTAAILGNSALWTNDPQKGIRVNTFDTWKKESFTLDRGLVSGFVGKIAGVLKPVLIVLVALTPVFLFFALSIGYLVYLFFGALLVLIVGKVRHVDLSYGQAYRLGLHLITVPVFYGLMKDTFPVLDFPLVFSAILAIFAYINLEPTKEVPAEATAEEV